MKEEILESYNNNRNKSLGINENYVIKERVLEIQTFLLVSATRQRDIQKRTPRNRLNFIQVVLKLLKNVLLFYIGHQNMTISIP